MPLFPEFPALNENRPANAVKSTAFQKALRVLSVFFWTVGLVVTIAAGIRLAVLLCDEPAEFEEGTVLRLNFDDGLYESRPSDLVGSLTFGNPPTVADAVFGLNRAAKDKNITGVIAYMTDMPLTLAQTQEIRNAVKALRHAGKKTVFYAPTIGELGGGLKMYYLASAFDEIRVQPNSEIGLAGIGAEAPYFKKALQRIGVKPSFSARYEYKSGADSFNAEKMSAAEREDLTKIMNGFIDVMASEIAEDRGFDVKKARDLLLNGPYFAEDALKLKLIDKIEYADELEKEIKENAVDLVDLYDYAAATAPVIKGKTPVVALVPAIGIIQFGDSVFAGDASQSVLGTTDFSSQLREAADDDSVKAIVIRLDSPGGGYTASEVMRREIEHIKAVSKKPVICSMASTAASGGYFISLACDKVFADKATLTGSVGVFGGKFVIKELLDKLNITVDTLNFGKNAGLTSVVTDFSPDERRFFEASLDNVYRDFTGKVAKRRGFTPQQIDKLARGRVFTGAQAESNKMVDATGGLTEAVLAAAEMAKMPTDTFPAVIEYPYVPTRWEMLLELANSGTAVKMRQSLKIKGVLPAFETLIKRLSVGDFRLFCQIPFIF